MNRSWSRFVWASTPCIAMFATTPASAAMRVESFDAAPTASEVDSFKAEILTLEPGTSGNLNPTNDWAQHKSGDRTRAMGLMYEMTHDQDILDRMIVFCDAVLSERNDLAAAPVGQHEIWTGNIEPVWPNATAAPIGTGGEQGDPIGHLAYCARLILETPSLWNASVVTGDPHAYGATYLERAKRFLKEADYSVDEHVLSELLDLSDQNRMYWAAGNPYMSGSVPWNQQVMFTYAFQNLAAAHLVLADEPERVVQYDAIVQASMSWFFSGEAGTAAPYTNAANHTAYLWAYRPPTGTEDWSHSNLDVQGIYRAFASGKYGITEAEMLPLANTFLDVVRRGAGDYAGRVDGTDGGGNSAPTTYVRPGWYVAALFRPADYLTIVSEDLTEGGTTTDVARFAYFLWVKCKLHPDECVLPEVPTAGGSGGTTGAAGGTQAGGAAGSGAGGAESSAGSPSLTGGTGGESNGQGGAADEVRGAGDDTEPSSCGCHLVGERVDERGAVSLIAATVLGGTLTVRRWRALRASPQPLR